MGGRGAGRQRPAIEAVVFDLDGTLWDTSATCAAAWNRVLARRAIEFRAITEHDVRRVTGRPHAECIREVFAGLEGPARFALIADTETEDNRAVPELGGHLYPRVVEGLPRLARRYPLFIVSNCQAGYIEGFLAWSELGACFRGFECWGNTGLAKPANLSALIERNRLRRAVLVGDTTGDQAAARDCGVPFIHAAYGFGACDGADHVFSTFAELEDWLLAPTPREATIE